MSPTLRPPEGFRASEGPASLRRTPQRQQQIKRKGDTSKQLYAEDNPKGVPPDTVDTLGKMLAFLDDMQEPEEMLAFR